MSAQITGSVGSYESGAVNSMADIKTVQALLTEAAKKKQKPAYDPGGIDGKISRIASRSGTVKAIGEFQRLAVGLGNIDYRIDVNGKTWQTLVAAAGTGAPAALPAPAPIAPQPVTGMVMLTVEHGNKIPTKTNGLTATETTMYESKFTLSGAVSGIFKGSIYPDNMDVKGRVVDGTYPLHIGFHKGGLKPKQTAADLVVRTKEIRAGLLVNARNSMPVKSNNPAKTTAVGINVHNGFLHNRYSDGCLTLQPTDWARFIEKILAAYPDIEDWHTIGANTGKRIGSLIVKA